MRKLDLTPIYDSLLDHIMSGSFQRANGRLPTERELAQHYGVARNTLRPVLKQLELEGYLTRQRSLGTHITPTCQKDIIYYLLPCPDFLEPKYADHSSFSVRLLSKVSRAVYDHGSAFRLLYATEDNQYGHINLANLAELRPGSRLIVNTSWYLPFFPLLRRRGVRVVFIGETTEEIQDLLKPEYLEAFHFLLVDCQQEAYDTYRHLHAMGARTIGLVGVHLVPNHPLVLGFQQACREFQGDETLIFTTKNKQFDSLSTAQKYDFYKTCLREHQNLDTLMIRNGLHNEQELDTLREIMMVSPTLALLTEITDEATPTPNMIVSQTSLTAMAAQAVNLLLAPTWQPGVDYLRPSFIHGS